jgi:hypothetical protein
MKSNGQLHQDIKNNVIPVVESFLVGKAMFEFCD